MCILTFVPEGVQPDAAALTNGADNNPDGHGFAIVDVKRNRIVMRRSMDPAVLIDKFSELRKKLDGGPALFHSRIATAGVVGKTNCHPFVVGGDPKTVVAHNGIMPREVQPVKGDWRSDTRIFAEELLSMRNFDGRRSMKKLAHWLAGDKLVILTVNPRWEANAYLVNSSKGEWDTETGIWYSNQSYRDDYNSYRWYSPGSNYKLRDCTNFANCRRQTYFIKCAECTDYDEKWWPNRRPGNFTECLFQGCRVRSVYAYCTIHAKEIVDGQRGAIEAGGSMGTDLLHTRAMTPCVICEAVYTVSTVTHVCTLCNTCQDCLEEAPGQCLCYTPARATELDVPPEDIPPEEASVWSPWRVDGTGTVVG